MRCKKHPVVHDGVLLAGWLLISRFSSHGVPFTVKGKVLHDDDCAGCWLSEGIN